jgi:nucleoside-diphosphate-sugar epimerase
MNKKILLIGASGFIGTNLLDYLNDKGYCVLNFDMSEPKNKNQVKFWKNINILEHEFLLKKTLLFNPDYIIHLAARTDLNGKTLNDYSANTIGVENVLKVSKQLPDLKKIIITSSMLVCSLGYTPKDQFDYHPTTVYGESKVITEKNVWANRPHCDWAIIRPTSIWGPWFDTYKNFFEMIGSRRYFHIGNKLCTKTYGYIDNTVYQIERILLTDTLSDDNKIFYLGDSRPTKIEEWADEIANIFDYKIIRVPYSLIFTAGLIGDLLKKIGISFPMTTFRLHNMTTDNIINLSNTEVIAPELPYSRIQGIMKTLGWLNIKPDNNNS